MRDLLLRFINALSMKPDTHGISEAPTDLTLLEGYSITGLQVLEKLYALAQDVVARNVPGDFVECGVWKGGSAAAVACAFRHTDRRAWLFDSFEGMSKPKPVDGAFAAQYADALVGSEEKAREAMQIVRFPEGKCIIRKGWFSDTFTEPLPQKVSLLHIDADWYDNVTLSLNTFYDRVAAGGIIILDDFGHWEGCREAFYDFVQQRGIKPVLERFGHTQAFWVKGRTHNREFVGKWEIP